MSGRSALERLGLERHQARVCCAFAATTSSWSSDAPAHRRRGTQLIAIAKQGRQQLEEQFAREREEARQHHHSS